MRSLTNAKIIGLNEANQMLPLLKNIAADIRRTWDAIIQKRNELGVLEKFSTHERPESQIKVMKEEENRLIDKINGYIKEVEELGGEVEEFKRGVINFPTLYHGRKVFLCWQADEDEVGFWHELDEDFKDRVRIKDKNQFLG